MEKRKYRPWKWGGIERDPKRPCLACGKRVGGKKQRRGSARIFCSNTCKLAHYYQTVLREQRRKKRNKRPKRVAVAAPSAAYALRMED